MVHVWCMHSAWEDEHRILPFGEADELLRGAHAIAHLVHHAEAEVDRVKEEEVGVLLKVLVCAPKDDVHESQHVGVLERAGVGFDVGVQHRQPLVALVGLLERREVLESAAHEPMVPEDDTLAIVLSEVKEVPHAVHVHVLLLHRLAVSLQLRRLVVRLFLLAGYADSVQLKDDERGTNARL